MPIVASDLKVRLSVKTGSAGNSTAQGDPNQSLGKYISTTDLTDNTLNNLFDDVSGDDNLTLDVEYRCLFIYNSHGSLTWQSPVIWLSGRRCVSDVNDTITSNSHGFTDTQTVRVEAELSTDAIPSGLNNSTTYYIRDAAANTFKLAATEGGAAIDIGASTGFATRAFGTTTMAIAVDTTASSAVGSATAQGEEVANENTAPGGGITFSSPITKATGLSLGNIVAGNVKAIWVRRTATNSAARNNDMATLGFRGDTAA